MQVVNVLSAIAAMAATASATQAGEFTTSQLMASFNSSLPYSKIVNRCNYDVHLWSVLKSVGCGAENMVTLKKGEVYHENLQNPVGDIGVSIKISKTQQCKGVDITQLEYFLQRTGLLTGTNFLDVSYVDCLGKDCPTMKDGYYLKAGDQSGKPSSNGYATTSTANNKICPVISCTDEASCSKNSYVLPDDEQTRSCGLDQNLEFYLCGGNPPSDDDSKPASSSKKIDTPAAKPTPSKASSAAENVKVNAAAITPAAEIKEPAHTPKVKTNVVYVTKYEYVNAKRHEHVHAHARRHQNFHA